MISRPSLVFLVGIILVLAVVIVSTFVGLDASTGGGAVYSFNCNLITENYYIKENKLTSKQSGAYCEFTQETLTRKPEGGYVSPEINNGEQLTELKFTSECIKNFDDLSKRPDIKIVLDEEKNLFECHPGIVLE